MSISTGAASLGPTATLASGTKISAEPNPENPRAKPATKPTATKYASVPAGGTSRASLGRPPQSAMAA